MRDPTPSPRLIAGDYRAVLPLAADRKPKTPTVLVMVAAGVFVVPLGLMAAAMPLAAGVPAAGALMGILVGVAVIASFGWLCLAHVRQTLKPAVVTLEDGMLKIEYPVLFREPLCVPYEAIRSVTFDRGDDTSHRHERFRLGDAAPETEDARWLWRRWESSPVPMLSALKQEPNAAILFEPAPLAPPLRREVAHGPLRGEALTGLMLEFADPQSAEAAFSYLGVVRQLSADDAAWIAAGFAGAPPALLVV